MTKNQQVTVKMSALPMIVIILLVLGAGFLLMKGEIKLPKFSKGPKVSRLENFPQTVFTDRIIEKQRTVLKTQQELNDFLNAIDSSGMLVVKENIDFEKNMIIAVATSTNDETGHKLRIKSVYDVKEKGKLLVSAEEAEAGENCVVDNDKNIVVDLVMITKTDKEIDFERKKSTEECEKTVEDSVDTIETDPTNTTEETVPTPAL